ncbi:TPA: ABC transporter ATP-binding protein [Candidatus Woesearchaeota archaeon]|nr:ABC transporter ATP-binding protein [Candidatus Woesearchaeota archaeon]
MLEIKNMVKKFGEFTALHGISFNLKENELVSFLGTNGCGKTTTIKIIVGFVEETSGQVIYDGKAMSQSIRSRYIGWAPQEDSFYGNLTLYENLIYFGNLNNVLINDAKKRAVDLLKMLKLDHKRNTLAKDLSGGMKRRLNMAVAMMHSPKILILDEPEAGVDPMSRVTLWEVVNEVKKSGTTILLVTHNLVETEHLADRLVVMDSGKVVFQGTAAEMKKKYKEKNIENAFKRCVEKH